MPLPKPGQGPWESLAALLDPKASIALRLKGLRLYVGFLLVLQGGALLLLAWVLPQITHPSLWALALGGGLWLLVQAEGAWRGERQEPFRSLLGVGLGSALFFFLGVMGLMLRPLGLLLLLLGTLGFLYLWHRSEQRLLAQGRD